jgi:hypothetical protein
VEQANCLLERARLLPGGVGLVATGHGERVLVFAGFPAGAPVLVGLGETQTQRQADADGRLEVRIEGPGETTVTVRQG